MAKRFHNSAFKSPLRQGPTESSRQEDVESLKRDIRALELKQKQLDTEIHQLQKQGYKEEELGSHINMLHEYNDIKDMGQMLLGHIAMKEGVTTKDLYERFDLDLND